MNYSEQQLESMVRQVLERLSAQQQIPNRPESSKPATVAAQPSTSGNQTLNARVIGTRELEVVKSETKRVIVQRGTVVTPAARDWLREKRLNCRGPPAETRQNQRKVKGKRGCRSEAGYTADRAGPGRGEV